VGDSSSDERICFDFLQLLLAIAKQRKSTRLAAYSSQQLLCGSQQPAVSVSHCAHLTAACCCERELLIYSVVAQLLNSDVGTEMRLELETTTFDYNNLWLLFSVFHSKTVYTSGES
jgi:hypothetical protein